MNEHSHVNVQCNLCASEDFLDMRGRVKARCAGCGALERTRLLWMYLQRMSLHQDMAVLHIAPEPGLVARLVEHVGTSNYRLADLEPGASINGMPVERLDLCDLDSLRPGSFDLILHSHVLEHTRCSLGYTLYHLHRALAPSGKHVFVIPFLPGGYAEDYDPPDGSAHNARFGQADHVRRFGVDDLGDTLGTLLRLPERWSARDDIGEQELISANVPRRLWEGFHGSTVLVFGRNDMRLLMPDNRLTTRPLVGRME